MKKRGIGLFIVLMLFVPFYSIYWYCSVQNQLKQKIGRGFGGLGHLLLTIFTFGIYSIYWFFVVGGRLKEAGAREDKGIIIGVLALIGLAIVSAVLIQQQINEIE